MKSLTKLIIVCAALALPACGPDAPKKDDKAAQNEKKAPEKADAKQADDKQPDEAGADDKKPDDAAAGAPPFTHIAFVRHAVEDYATWKTAFDGHQAARADAGVVHHWVNQDPSDPNVVMVVIAANDLSKIQEMMGSDDMKKRMEEGGVKGPPEVVFMGAIKDSKPPAEGVTPVGDVFVLQEVEDFDKWLASFTAHEGARTDASVVTHGVVLSDDPPNMVGVHVGYTDEAKMKAFMESDDLKKAMADAGVKGEPKMWFAKQVEDKDYAATVAAK